MDITGIVLQFNVKVWLIRLSHIAVAFNVQGQNRIIIA